MALGRTLVAVGVLLLLFALFQLWGTGIAEARAQEALTARFQTHLSQAAPADLSTDPTAATPDSAPAGTAARPVVEASQGAIEPARTEPAGTEPARTEPAGTEPAGTESGQAPPDPHPTTQPATAPPPEPGQPVAVLSIPAIDVNKTVVEGTSRDLLRSGPGHYRFTPLPGQPGNVAVAGHRTTHGAPFFDIDLLAPGDEINVETMDGTFTYLVQGFDDGGGAQVGHRIVEPEDVGVIADHGDDRLTLTACHPKYSARQRIVVTAILQPDQAAPDPPDPAAATIPTEIPATENPATEIPAGHSPALENPALENPALENPADANTAIARSLGWQRDHAGATALWAALTTLIAAAGALVGRHWRRWPAYAMTVPPFGLALFQCFAELERLLPAM